MKPTELRWMFIAVLAVFLFVSFWNGPLDFGVDESWTNGSYRFAAGTHPGALALSILILFLYILLLFSEPIGPTQPLPGVFRRFVAFYLDLFLAIFLIAPIFGVFPVLIEWRRTGVFQWNFERTTLAPGDVLMATSGIGLTFAALVFYFAIPLARKRPSPGSCIAGYQILPEDNVTLTLGTAMLRTSLGFVAVSAFYLAPFLARDRKKGQFWLDKVFGTRAVRLS